jgi:polyhydroxybutyrate depolymerase
MGHQWPGGLPFPPWLMGAPSDDVDATQEIWAFFDAHPMAAEQE